MISTNEFKKGVYIELDGVPYQIVEFQHVKPGKGNSFTRTRIKNLVTGNTIDRTFKSGERCEEPELETKRMQYLYKDGNGYQFLDLESYEQAALEEASVGDNKNYLTENLEIEVLYFRNRPITVELPNFVQLAITYCEPAVKGDTVSGGGKPATLSTGLVISVPYHIKQGDLLKVDTRTGEYVEKVK
ncbi:elongation factor P [bacterium]|nr:elongation factor P [bacterium]